MGRIIFLLLLLNAFSAFSQNLNSETFDLDMLRKQQELLKEKKYEEALVLIQDLKQQLLDAKAFNNPQLFRKYSFLVRSEGNVYVMMRDFDKRAKLFLDEANKVKPYISNHDALAEFYFSNKHLSASSLNPKSYTSPSHITENISFLHSLLQELDATSMQDVKTKKMLKGLIASSYFSNRNMLLSAQQMEALKDMKPTSATSGSSLLVENQEKSKELLNEVLAFEDFEGKTDLIASIRRSITMLDTTINMMKMAEGKYDETLKSAMQDSTLLKLGKQTAGDAGYFSMKHAQNMQLSTAGMYHQLINKEKALLEELNKSSLKTTDAHEFIKINCLIHSALPGIFIILEDYDSAKYYAEQGKAYFKQLPPDKRDFLDASLFEQILATVYFAQGKFDTSIQYSLEVLKNKQGFYVSQYQFLGMTYYMNQDYAKAIDAYHHYLDSFDSLSFSEDSKHQAYLHAYRMLGVSYMANGQYAEALNYLELSGSHYKQLGADFKKHIEFLDQYLKADRAILFSKMKQLEQADASMLQFVESYTITFFESLLVTHDAMRDKGLEKPYSPNLVFYYISQRGLREGALVAQGYNYALLSKQLLLNTKQIIRKHASLDTYSDLKQINAKWLEVDKALKQLEVAKRDSLLDYARMYEKELIERGKPSIVELFKNSKLSWQAVQQQLNTGEVALEFVSFTPYDFERQTEDVHYGVYILKQDAAPVYINLFKASELRNLLASVPSGASSKAQVNAIYGAQSGTLFDLIWRPIEVYLKGSSKIYFSPSGELHNFSFYALKDEQQGKLLSEKYQLIQLTTTRNLIDRKAPPRLKQAVLSGAINYNSPHSNGNQQAPASSDRGSGFQQLAGTKKEIEAINEVLESHHVTTMQYTGDEVTET
ncbi:MAG TPA: CHAT domain-containing protein, partial [Sphingobacteriaceae bacterium]|nr:CHAT domain-containing protein [Sphingobacteriaceae bacterium]